MLDENILKMQKINDKVFVLLFLYNKNMKINLPIIDKVIAEYGKYFNSSPSIIFNIYYL